MKTPKTIKVQIYSHEAHSCYEQVMETEKVSNLFLFLNWANNKVQAEVVENQRHSQYTGNDTIQFYVTWANFDFVFYWLKHSRVENEMLRDFTDKIVKYCNE